MVLCQLSGIEGYEDQSYRYLKFSPPKEAGVFSLMEDKMSEEEDKLFVQWLDDYEILIFRTAKEFIEKFELEG